MTDLLTDADVCVKCGLCLNTCPTYNKTLDENQSPRGRIALIQGYATGALSDIATVQNAIDQCLLCKECEHVCPAQVPYSRLIDRVRAQFFNSQHSTLASRVLSVLAHSKTARQFASTGLTLYQTTGLQTLARRLQLPKLFGLASVDRLLTNRPVSTPLADYYPARITAKGNVGLFVGCMGELLDFTTIHAAIQVLTAVGFNVHIPNQQCCCGALALHSGDQTTALQLEQQNVSAFANMDSIITLASGCGSQLQDYQHSPFANKIIDISQFLLPFIETKQLQALNATVCLHTPCSLRNGMQAGHGALQLLQKIPDLSIVPLANTLVCCGSAGRYLLQQPKMANALVADVIHAIPAEASYLVTSNIGCALHIAAGLQEQGKNIEVLHPVTLLAGQFLSA